MMSKKDKNKLDREAMDSYTKKLISRVPLFERSFYFLFNFLVPLHPSCTYFDRESCTISFRNCDFMKDPAFIKGWNARMEICPTWKEGKWLLHVTQWAVEHAKKLDGDFVECGVFKGSQAMFNIVYLDFNKLKDKKYYLFDTYEGFDPKWSSKEELEVYKDFYPDSYQFVKDAFKPYPNVVIVKGPVPDTLSKVDIEEVAYLSIDMGAVLPEVEALKFFWPKMVGGWIIVLDNYGLPGHEKLRKCHDEFASSVGVKILSLQTGQGIMIKP